MSNLASLQVQSVPEPTTFALLGIALLGLLSLDRKRAGVRRVEGGKRTFQRISMKISARNQFGGTIKAMVKGPVSTEVTVSVAPDVDVVAVISTASADSLGLTVGKSAHVLIKASSVLVGVD